MCDDNAGGGYWEKKKGAAEKRDFWWRSRGKDRRHPTYVIFLTPQHKRASGLECVIDRMDGKSFKFFF